MVEMWEMLPVVVGVCAPQQHSHVGVMTHAHPNVGHHIVIPTRLHGQISASAACEHIIHGWSSYAVQSHVSEVS